MDIAFFLKLFAALFAIMNPIANLPVFLSLTGDRDISGQRAIALTVIAGLAVGTVLVALAGEAILNLFGLSVDSFRLAGGLLILLIALKMVSGEQSKSHSGTDQEKQHHETLDNPGVYPLTVPLLLGPGTISTLIIFRQQTHGAEQLTAYAAAVAASVGLLGATFLAAPWLGHKLGQTATSIMSRLMGMILAAIAMEMMTTSLKALLPGLA